MAERTDDCGCIAMSLLRFGETSWVRKSPLDGSEGRCGRSIRRIGFGQCLGETLASPERSFVWGLRFEESVQKLVQEERFNRTVELENRKRLEGDLIATSDGEEIAGAGRELTEELSRWGEDDREVGCF